MARLDHQVTGPDDAPALLLGGALGSTHTLWQEQAGALSDRFRVVAFDHRGHGGSEVPGGPYAIADLGADVLALMDDLGLEHASYAGISLGGMVGLWLAAHAPGRIERLVVMCAAAVSPVGPEPWNERAASVRQGGVAAVADGVLARWFPAPYAEANPDRVAAIRQDLLDTPAEGYAGCCEAIRDMDLRDTLDGITAPTLVLAAEGDQSIPAEHVLPVANGIAGARFEVIEDAAHLIAVTHVDQVNHLLLDHLAGATP
jgi:3-oxoadipate enol-lactonase